MVAGGMQGISLNRSSEGNNLKNLLNKVSSKPFRSTFDMIANVSTQSNYVVFSLDLA